MARYKLQGIARDGAGNIIADASVSVYLAGTTTAASVYEASSGGTAVNSVDTDDEGFYELYVDSIDYSLSQNFKITISKSGYTSKTFDEIDIFPGLPDYEIDVSSIYGNGSKNATILNTAITAVGTIDKMIFVLYPGVWTIDTDVTVPSNITLKIPSGALLQISTGVTLTINGLFEAGLYQVFDCVGTGNVGGLKESFPEWWTANEIPGTTDMRAAIQAAADSLTTGSGVLDLGTESYRVSRVQGINDSWGVKITNSGVRVKGDGATLRRTTGIATYELAYPIILIGTPDSNVAAATENIIIEGIHFIGEDTRHTTNGSCLTEKRTAIEVKNTINVTIRDNLFTDIDSQAINFQGIAVYDYVNSVYYGTTKNYNAKIIGNRFIAKPHAVAGRALLHAIFARYSLDGLDVSDNYFEWCDVAIGGQTSYDTPDKDEDDLWTPTVAGWGLGAVKRAGRDWVISNNIMVNSSEHSIYLELNNFTISNNVITVTEPTICHSVKIQIRGRYGAITGNSFNGVSYAVSLLNYTSHMVVSGNTISTINEAAGLGGVFNISTGYIKTAIDNRPWISVLSGYPPMENISISNNVITMDPTATAWADAEGGAAIRLVSDLNLAEYPQGSMQNVTVQGNIIKNAKFGILMINDWMRNIKIDGNTFVGKSFVEAGFSTATVMNSSIILAVRATTPSAAAGAEFRNNRCYGFEYFLATPTGLGVNVRAPYGIRGNRFDYIKYLKSVDVLPFSNYNDFRDNSGIYFLDTSWGSRNTRYNHMGVSIIGSDMPLVSHDYGGGTTAVTLNSVQAQAETILLSNAGGDVDCLLPAGTVGALYTLRNLTGHVVTFKVAGATGDTVQNGKMAIFVSTSSDVFKVYEQP